MARIDPERIRGLIEEKSLEIKSEVLGNEEEVEYRRKCAEQIFALLKNQSVIEALLRRDDLSAQKVTIDLIRGRRDDAPNMKHMEVLGVVIGRSGGVGKREISLKSRLKIESVRYSADVSIHDVDAAKQWAYATFGDRYHVERVSPWGSNSRNDYAVELVSTFNSVDSFLLAYGSRAEEVLVALYKMFYPAENKPVEKEPPLDLLGEES